MILYDKDIGYRRRQPGPPLLWHRIHCRSRNPRSQSGHSPADQDEGGHEDHDHEVDEEDGDDVDEEDGDDVQHLPLFGQRVSWVTQSMHRHVHAGGNHVEEGKCQ